MEDPANSQESLQEFLLSSARSTGFWSFVAATVGVVAFAAGGLFFKMKYLADDLRKHMADEVKYRDKNDERWTTHERGHA